MQMAHNGDSRMLCSINIKRQTVAAERRGVMIHEFIHAHTDEHFWQWCFAFGNDPAWRNIVEGFTQVLTLEIIDEKEGEYQTCYLYEVEKVIMWMGRAGVTADGIAMVMFQPESSRAQQIFARLKRSYYMF